MYIQPFPVVHKAERLKRFSHVSDISAPRSAPFGTLYTGIPPSLWALSPIRETRKYLISRPGYKSLMASLVPFKIIFSKYIGLL